MWLKSFKTQLISPKFTIHDINVWYKPYLHGCHFPGCTSWGNAWIWWLMCCQVVGKNRRTSQQTSIKSCNPFGSTRWDMDENGGVLTCSNIKLDQWILWQSEATILQFQELQNFTELRWYGGWNLFVLFRSLVSNCCVVYLFFIGWCPSFLKANAATPSRLGWALSQDGCHDPWNGTGLTGHGEKYWIYWPLGLDWRNVSDVRAGFFVNPQYTNKNILK